MKKRAVFFGASIIVVIILIVFGILSWIPQTTTNQTVNGFQWRMSRWSGTITIVGDTYIAPWISLTIEPGTMIRFEKEADFPGTDWEDNADAYIKDHDDPTGRVNYKKTHYRLYGKIIAKGTATEPIIFTSAQTEPEYADWDELILRSKSQLDYVELAYAHNGINIAGSDVVVQRSTIHDSLWSCVDIFSVNNVIENNTIYHCWHQAIGTKVIGKNTIQQNTIHDANLSVNCEYNSNPSVRENHIEAAPLDPNCNAENQNTIIDRAFDTPGGTYNRTLIYPATR